MENGLLLPTFFFLCGFVASCLAYVVLVALAPGKPEPRSSRNSLSFVGAIIGLFLYFLLAAGVLVALTAALGALAGTGKPTVHADAGSVALIGAVVSGLLARWRNRKEESKRAVKPLIGWVRRSADFIQKLALGLAVFVVIVAGLACALVLVEGVLRWYGAGEPAAAHYLAFTAAAGALLLILGFAIDFNKLSLHYFYRDRLVEAFLRTVAQPLSAAWGASPELKRDHSQMGLFDLHGHLDGGPAASAPAAGGATKAGGGLAEERTFRRYPLRAPWLDRVQIWKTLEPAAEPFAGVATAAPYCPREECAS